MISFIFAIFIRICKNWYVFNVSGWVDFVPLSIGYSHPRGPTTTTTMVMRPRSFASPACPARMTRTKRKLRQNETDLSIRGGRTSCTTSPEPPIQSNSYAEKYMKLTSRNQRAFAHFCKDPNKPNQWKTSEPSKATQPVQHGRQVGPVAQGVALKVN